MNENSQSQTCSRCGATLAPGALMGLCPRCLLALNLATQTEVSGDDVGPTGTQVVKPPPAPALSPEEIARLFPQFEILECLGRGGMGVVYKARQPRLDRLVALKILTRDREDATRDARFAERFEREARALAKLSHPNIVAMYEFGQAEGLPYFIMEYVDGLNLRQLEQAGKLAPREALEIIPQICEALQFAHDEGIIHRDIKPENILLDKKGRVKIADFGIAKILAPGAQDFTQTGGKDVVGTPHYMAPEQVEKPRTVDHRADIYSLGVVFYEMLTGELPLGKFAAPSKKVQVDVRLDEVVLHALEKEPERRYQHASDVKSAVETIAGTQASAVDDKALVEARGRVKAPGLGLCFIGAANTLFAVGWLLWLTLGAWGASQQPGAFEHGDLKNTLLKLGLVTAPILLVVLVLGVFVVAGGWYMRRLQHYPLAVAASILAVFSPLGLLGLPISIWSLIVLMDSKVREAFAAVGRAKKAPDQGRLDQNQGRAIPAEQPRPSRAGQAARWTARILGTLWALRFLVIYSAEGSPPLPTQPVAVQMAFAALALMLAGVVAGWWRDGLAALLMLGGWALFHVAEGHVPAWSLFHVAAVGGVLFALSWAGRWRATSHDEKWERRLATTAAIIGLPVLFALLLNLGSNRPAPGPVVAVESPLTFGPEIKGVISQFDAEKACFDLDSGKYVALPDAEWMSADKLRQAGVDLYHSAIQNNLDCLDTIDLLLVPLEGVGWEKVMPASVVDAISRAQNQQVTYRRPSASMRPGIYAFFNGTSMGLLQNAGMTGPSPGKIDGVKFRYRLLSGTATSPATSARYTAATNLTFSPVIERVLPFSAPCRMQYFQFHTGNVFTIGDGPNDKTDHAEDYRRAEETGGLDMSVIGGKAGLQLAGRGCVFTRDKSLNWDTMTAEAAMQTLRRESWLNGVVEIKQKDFPATYLFKTARGECGLLQILGVSDEPLGMKFRYKLVQRGEGAGKQSVQIEPIEKASSAPALAGSGAMTFGPEGKGLRAAVELISSNGVFTLGEPIEVLFHIRNTSSTNIYVAGGSWRQDEAHYIRIEDQQGRQIPAQHIYHSVRTPIQRNLLLPGESAVFHSSGLAFLAKDADGKQVTQPVGNYVKVTPGRYTVRYRLHFPDLLTTGFPQSSDWQGDLDTAPVTVDVTTANTSAAAPAFGPVIERVIQPCASPGFPALDLDTGKVVTSGDAMPAMPDMESPVMEAWRQKTGADIVVVPLPNKSWQIRHFLALVQISSRKWDEGEMLPQQVKNLLGAASSTSGVMSFSKTPDPATFVFETRKRTAGIIQLLDVADQPRGVKLRYKLVQDVTAPPAAPASAHIPSFGPVIERVLDFDTDRKAAYLNLDTGEYVDPGTNATNSLLSMKATPAGVDLRSSSVESNFDVRWGINLAVVPVAPTRWEATPEEILMAVGSVKRQPEIRLSGGRSTNTWFFQTSEGGRGVLQFLPPKAGDDPSQVRLRYRLVQPASPSGSSTVKPKATTEQVIVEDRALFFVKTHDGWRSGSLRNSPSSVSLVKQFADFRAETKPTNQ